MHSGGRYGLMETLERLCEHSAVPEFQLILEVLFVLASCMLGRDDARHECSTPTSAGEAVAPELTAWAEVMILELYSECSLLGAHKALWLIARDFSMVLRGGKHGREEATVSKQHSSARPS